MFEKFDSSVMMWGLFSALSAALLSGVLVYFWMSKYHENERELLQRKVRRLETNYLKEASNNDVEEDHNVVANEDDNDDKD